MGHIESIVHIEGADKTGKDTIRDFIVKNNNKICVIVRSYISQIVYSRLYNRELNESFYFAKITEEYRNGVNFILLVSDIDDVEKRFIEHDEKDIKIDEFLTHQKMFKQVVIECRKQGINVLVVNTSHNNIEETSDKILNFL